jgi:hypothetical protein
LIGALIRSVTPFILEYGHDHPGVYALPHGFAVGFRKRF